MCVCVGVCVCVCVVAREIRRKGAVKCEVDEGKRVTRESACTREPSVGVESKYGYGVGM